MSSAKKKGQSEWKLCVNCNTYFPRGICVKHEKKCGLPTEDGTTEEESQLFTGFIEYGKLHGICKYIDRDNDLLPSTKNDLIVVHPSAINKCCFQTTSNVLISYNDKKITSGTVWPSTSIPVDGIGLRSAKYSTLGVEEGAIIEISLSEVPTIIADEIVLKPMSDDAAKNFESISSTLLYDLDGGNILKGDHISIPFYGEELFFSVCSVNGDLMTDSNQLNDSSDTLEQKFQFLSVNGNTKIKDNVFLYTVMMNITKVTLFVDDKKYLSKDGNWEMITQLERMGGLGPQMEMLKELIETPITYPSLFSKCGIELPKGIIIHGVSGTGKTALVHSFVDSLNTVYTSFINGPELTSKFHGETEQKLRDVFNETKKRSPSVLVIDEFDVICPARTSSSSESEKRVVATLATLFDSIKRNEMLFVIAITSKLDQIDLSLRRPGRFDKEVEIGVPNAIERGEIFGKLLLKCKHSLKKEDISELAGITHGYVGSDLNALVKEAGMVAIKNIKSLLNAENIESLIDNFSVTLHDFKTAMCNIRPSAMKAVMIDIPKVYWTDIGGQEHVKQKMKEAIEWPLKHPDVFRRMGISPPRGLLMYGPPGCSKTLTAKAIATESGLNFISIKGPELFNKYLGESEKAIRDVFSKARISAPSIVFFDEIDAIGVQRSNGDSGGNNVGDRVLAQLLTELDGVESLDGVIIIAATNRPDIIDPALVRPGRIDRLVYVPLPDEETRREIFELQFKQIPVAEDVDVNTLVALSERYSGAEICSLCREAAMISLRENFDSKEISLRHFESVFEQIKPGISDESISFYENFRNKTTGSF